MNTKTLIAYVCILAIGIVEAINFFRGGGEMNLAIVLALVSIVIYLADYAEKTDKRIKLLEEDMREIYKVQNGEDPIKK